MSAPSPQLNPSARILRHVGADSPRAALSASTRLLALTIPGLLLILFVAMNLQQRLPGIRVPTAHDGAAQPQTAGALLPGTRSVLATPARTTGRWFQQPLGTETSLATDNSGSTIELRFFGTSVAMRVRVGPEAGKVYVAIDGEPVSHLSSDSKGSFIDLSALQAQDQQVPLADGLALEEHVLRLSNGPDGQLAISSFTTQASTPFPWAFAALYALLILLLFLAVRAVFVRCARAWGWIAAGTESEEPGGERR